MKPRSGRSAFIGKIRRWAAWIRKSWRPAPATARQWPKGRIRRKPKRALDALEQKRAALLSAAHADLEPHFRCPLCRDTGMGPEGICDCFRRELIAENFKQANLEQGLCSQSFEQFDFSLFDPAPLGGHALPAG